MPDQPEITANKRAPRNPVPYQLREWTRRADLVMRALELMKRVASVRAAALETGVPITSLWSYVRAFRKLGVAGLMPDISTGAPSATSKIALTEAEAAAISALSYKLIRKQDIAAGCRAYAAHPECRTALRDVLSAGRIPSSVRAAVKAHLPKTDQ